MVEGTDLRYKIRSGLSPIRPDTLWSSHIRQNGVVHKEFSATTEATPDDLFGVVSDLETYPHWLDVVDSVDQTDQPDAWIVTLRARVGPFARSKRLRMVRTVNTEGPTPVESPDVDKTTGTTTVTRSVRFERQEVDGKNHSAWTLAADVGPLSGDHNLSEVTLDLEYEGAMWSGLLDGVLDAAADRATKKLQSYVSA